MPQLISAVTHSSTLLFPLSSLSPCPGEVLGLFITQSNQGPVRPTLGLHLKWRCVWRHVPNRELRSFFLDCRYWQHCHQEHLTKVITAGHEVGGVLPTDLTLVGHTCGTGDTYTGIYGKKQLHKAAAKWICQRLFDCARCLQSHCLQQQQLPRDRL